MFSNFKMLHIIKITGFHFRGSANCMLESLIFCPNEWLLSPFILELFLDKNVPVFNLCPTGRVAAPSPQPYPPKLMHTTWRQREKMMMLTVLWLTKTYRLYEYLHINIEQSKLNTNNIKEGLGN